MEVRRRSLVRHLAMERQAARELATPVKPQVEAADSHAHRGVHFDLTPRRMLAALGLGLTASTSLIAPMLQNVANVSTTVDTRVATAAHPASPVGGVLTTMPVDHVAWDNLPLPVDDNGSIVVATVGHTLQGSELGPNSPAFQAQKLLGEVASEHASIVYVAANPAEVSFVQHHFPGGLVVTPGSQHRPANLLTATLQSLEERYPRATFNVLGNDDGHDADAAALGSRVQVYLQNTDATQKNVPRGFQGVLTDVYGDDFISRFVADVDRAGPSGSAQPLGPVIFNPPATNDVPSGLQRLGQELQFMVGGLEHYLTSAHPAVTAKLLVQQLQGPLTDQTLRHLNTQTLASYADQLVQAKDIAPADASTQLLRLLTVRGTEPGLVDGVVSRMQHAGDIPTHLQGTDAVRFQTIQKQGRAIPGDWDGFNHYVDQASETHVTTGNRVTPLVNGPAGLGALRASIASAKDFIFVNYHTFGSDQASWDVARELATAAHDRGVPVRLMYDQWGSSGSDTVHDMDPAMLKYLRQNGVEVVERPTGPFVDSLSHRKIATMDDGHGGMLAYTGGMNINDDHAWEWNDVMARIEGPAVTDLQKLLIQQFGSLGKPFTASQIEHMLVPQPTFADNAAVRVMGHVGRQDQNIKLTYLRAIDTCTSQDPINIADPYILDADVFNHLITAAQERHVPVRLFMPLHNNEPAVQAGYHAWYNKLISAGIEIYEYDGAPMMHGKPATFGTHLGTLGTSNLDHRSLLDNDEDNIWIMHRPTVQNLIDKFFAPDLLQSTVYSNHRPTWMGPTGVYHTSFNPGLVGTLKDDVAQKFSWFL